MQALQDVSFEAADGRITGLLGHNGAGKSTTLRMLSTVLRADTGSAHRRRPRLRWRQPLAGTALARRAASRERVVRASHRAREHSLLRPAARPGTAPELNRASDELIERLGLAAVADRRAKGYSQGERLKVALARALVHRPQTIILDEPTNGLDVNAVRMLRELIRELRTSGAACCSPVT